MNQHKFEENDILPFQLENSNVRGRFGRLNTVIDQILKQHDYPKVVEALIVEATILTALIGQMLKFDWKLSLQIRGDGPIRLIATDYYGPTNIGTPAKIRAYASYENESINIKGGPFQQIGSGFFAMIITQGTNTTPYQGITPLAGRTLSECAENYFFQSEQIPTKFSISFGENQLQNNITGWRAGGIMLQHMPAPKSEMLKQEKTITNPKNIKFKNLYKEHWSRVKILLNTVEDLELIGPNFSKEVTLFRLFHEENTKIYESQNILFGCTCSEEKVRQSMSIYSSKELKHMTTKEGLLTADCQFCGAHYILDPKILGFEASKN